MVVKIPLVLQPAERTALQAALGSDPKREIIAIWEQLNNPDEDTNTLFKPNGVEA